MSEVIKFKQTIYSDPQNFNVTTISGALHKIEPAFGTEIQEGTKYTADIFNRLSNQTTKDVVDVSTIINNYTASLTNLLATDLTDDLKIILKPNNTNLGPATLNLESLGNILIKKGNNQDLEANDIIQHSPAVLKYSTEFNAFMLINPLSIQQEVVDARDYDGTTYDNLSAVISHIGDLASQSLTRGDEVKELVVNALVALDDSLTITTSSTWEDITSAIGSVSTDGVITLNNTDLISSFKNATWEETEINFPETSFSAASAVYYEKNDVILIFGYNIAYQYNYNNNTFVKLTGQAISRSHYSNICSSSTYGDVVHFIGTSSSISNVNIGYSIVSNVWYSYASAIQQVRSNTPAVSHQNLLYVCGGANSNFSILQIYNSATNSWSTGANMLLGVREATAVYYNNKIYVCGGRNSSGGYVNNLQIYDIATNTWSAGANFPLSGIYGGRFLAIGKNLYLIGGYYLNALDTVFIYNPATNTWTSSVSFFKVQVYMPLTTVKNNAYAVYGITNPTQKIYIYNIPQYEVLKIPEGGIKQITTTQEIIETSNTISTESRYLTATITIPTQTI